MTVTPVALEAEAALSTALAKAQGEFPPIPRTAEVKTASYSFRYAPLDAILGAVRPVLSQNGLALVQLLDRDLDGRPMLRTELRHAEGAQIGAGFPLPKIPDTPQQLGSLLTYLRRYAIVAILGIAPDEDDDAQTAVARPAAPVDPSRSELKWREVGPGPDFGFFDDEPPQDRLQIDEPVGSSFKAPKTKEPSTVDARPLTDPQRKKIYAMLGKLRKADQAQLDKVNLPANHYTDDNVRQRIGALYGTESVTELTRYQARQLIDQLQLSLDAIGLE